MKPGRSRKLRSLAIGAAIAVGASLGTLAPTALAAAPVNDNFAERTQLGDELPVHLTESNVEATRESAEHINDFSKGRSIWWEWEAPSSGWTTVSVCGSEMYSYVNVFEGTELVHLTSLTERRGNGDEGPQCWASQSTYTFAATAGHKYVIGADGNGYYIPPPPPEEPVIPSGEGTIKLSIEATPPPPNDAFADAIRLGEHFYEVNQSPFEEPNDDEYFIEQKPGYNWGATKQAGEPDHAGDPGGASVWYAWTPTRSGEVSISLQGMGGPKLLALYEGSALANLMPLSSVSAPIESVKAPVIAGHEYRIAVDGVQGPENLLEPWRGSYMGSFTVSLQLKAPPLPPPGCGCSAEVERASPVAPKPSSPLFPTVTLGHHLVDSKAGSATFRFGSSLATATFICKVDASPYRACTSPFKVKGLKPGKHVFQVRASAGGTVSTTPAVVHFTVRTPHRRHHQTR
jgi:hypothetical protein